MPGNKANSSRVIHYLAELYASKGYNGIIKCGCIRDKYDKFTLGSNSPSISISNNMRISQLVKKYKGGKTQYGNFYLGQPLNVNYLGRLEGMPNGSGKPPVNKF